EEACERRRATATRRRREDHPLAIAIARPGGKPRHAGHDWIVLQEPERYPDIASHRTIRRRPGLHTSDGSEAQACHVIVKWMPGWLRNDLVLSIAILSDLRCNRLYRLGRRTHFCAAVGAGAGWRAREPAWRFT